MSPFLIPRAKRLAAMFPEPEIDRPLVKVYRFPPAVLNALARRVIDLSVGLDNITPNGAVMERPQIDKHYGLLRDAVRAELKTDGLSHLSPPILRVSREPHPERPFATDKMHSDIWRGEPKFAVGIIIALWGSENSFVKFREPLLDNFYPLDDYANGKNDGVDYEVPFVEGCIYYFDAMALHQTFRRRGSERVSIDMRGLYDEKLRFPSEDSPWPWASKFVAISPVEEKLEQIP